MQPVLKSDISVPSGFSSLLSDILSILSQKTEAFVNRLFGFSGTAVGATGRPGDGPAGTGAAAGGSAD
jgi:hypothetical protein